MNNEQNETLKAIYRLSTEANRKLDKLDERVRNLESELASLRGRMHMVEQQGLAFTEQGVGLHQRFDDMVRRLERIEKKLDRQPA